MIFKVTIVEEYLIEKLGECIGSGFYKTTSE